MTQKITLESRISIPNALSLLRILLTPLFLYLTYTQHLREAFICFFIASLTDWADGFFARRLHQESAFGALLDPVADKVLLTASYIGFYFLSKIPFYLVLIVVGRDLLILLASVFILLKKMSFALKANFISKINTVFQILYIFLVLLPTPKSLLYLIEATIAFTTITSGFRYLIAFRQWYAKESLP